MLVAAHFANGRSASSADGRRSNEDLPGATASADEFAPPSNVAEPPSRAIRVKPGLAIMTLMPGYGTYRPARNDCVRVRYIGWRRDGQLLGSWWRESAPESRCLSGMVIGIADAVKRMVSGERARVWIDSPLMSLGNGDDREPGVDATYDVELVEVVRSPPTPRDLRTPPASARRVGGGVALRVLVASMSDRRPRENSRIKLDFSGWTKDGTLVESSVMARHPVIYDMQGMMAGMREAVLAMVEGQKARIWIPQAMAFGDRPKRGQPKGDLVYDLELLAVDRSGM